MTLYAFYFLAFLSVLSALMVVFSRNPIYNVLYLVITFLCVGGHYLLLSADFLFAVHIIVYAGAIMVLFLYVIMLLNLNKETEPQKNTFFKFAAIITAGLLMIVIVGALRASEAAMVAFDNHNNIGLVKNLGKMLFNEFLLPFEIVSLLLLTAMVGAVMLGKNHMKRVKEVAKNKNGRATISTLPVQPVKELTHE
ncbi:MAG TPA: NADH-quinone oxidoreductase subunit J [Chryseosolibacter sp.]|nr:NADH-quinone oxidoreductase subunit J [Chryseosolibacter sp.]